MLHPTRPQAPMTCFGVCTKRQKQLEYEERIINVDHGSFCPLVFSTNGAVGLLCPLFEETCRSAHRKPTRHVFYYNGLDKVLSVVCPPSQFNHVHPWFSFSIQKAKHKLLLGETGLHCGDSVTICSLLTPSSLITKHFYLQILCHFFNRTTFKPETLTYTYH